MNAHEVNAYYDPSTNEICFPAGILQYPFFDMGADDAFNYGAIGAVIGHEMTHGFDDSGRHFDKDGNMKDWWTAADATGFEVRANVMKEFFNNIKINDEVNANGDYWDTPEDPADGAAWSGFPTGGMYKNASW